MFPVGRCSVWAVAVLAALGGAGVTRAEPLLGQEIKLRDAAGLFPTVTLTPNSDSFSYTWSQGAAGSPALKIDILETPGDDTHAQLTFTSLSSFTFPDPDSISFTDVNDTILPLVQVNIHDMHDLNLFLSDPTVINFVPGSAPSLFQMDPSGVVVSGDSSVKADLTFAKPQLVPEPGSLALFILGLGGLAGFARRRRVW